MKYFAYGSNMLRERLRARVGAVGEIGPAYLHRFRLTFHKRGRDGSGKCTINQDASEEQGVWGVVFELDAEQKRALDSYEGPDYAIRNVKLMRGGSRFKAFTYISREYHIDPSSRPFPWYKALVMAGGIQFDLPRHYLSDIESIPTIPDLNFDRASTHASLLSESGYRDLIAGIKRGCRGKTEIKL